MGLVSSVACEGVLLGEDENGLAPDTPDGSNESAERCAPRIERALLLLNELAFVNSLRDLLGPEALEGRLAPEAHAKPFTQKGYVANTSLVNSRLDWAIHATRHWEGRTEELTGCSNGDDACARSFLEHFARRAFRRPVGSEEIDDLMLVFAQGKETSFDQGIQLALQAIFVSPSFNHRTEYGTLTDSGSYELTPHELASVLSYLLTDSLPDEELLAAADSGALADAEERKRQILRLLERPEVRDSVEKTLLAAWTLGNLFGKVKDPGMFPEYSTALASQMYRETELFLKENLWDPERGLSSLLTSGTSYVNGALAELYGIPFPGDDPTEFVEVELPPAERSGLLTQASVLTTLARTDSTSVVARGLFVNGPLLCLPKIPAPPADAVAEVEAQLEHDLTERERAQLRAETSPCSSCHDQFDAFGLLFENYDAIGKYRTTLNGESIDATVDFAKNASFDGVYDNAVDFAAALAERPELTQCVTRHLLVYGTGEDALRSTDCEVQQVVAQLSEHSTLTDILFALAGSPALSVRKAEEAE